MSQVLREKEGFGLPRAVLVAALAALAVKLVLATTTQGTNDIRAFWYFLQEYRGSGAKLLYEKESEFNHPPFVIRWLTALRWLHQTTGWAPWFWVRLPAILADFGSVWIVARLVRARLGEASTRFTLLLVAAAPASVMISGFHGNNDPVMIFFVLVSILLLERRAPFWLAGLAMGMAVDMKVVPLVFWPAICLWLPSWRARFEYFGAAVSAIVVASLPWIVQEPALIARKVLLYKSSYGLWGISRILKGDLAFESWGRVFLAATLVGLALWMNRRPTRPPLFRQLAVLAFAFLVVTPGFGVQYLAWLVPWVAGAPLAAGSAFTATSACFLGLVYTFWCQGVPTERGDPYFTHAVFWRNGLPWDFANADRMQEWRGPIIAFEIACWLAVLWVLGAKLRGVRSAVAA